MLLRVGRVIDEFEGVLAGGCGLKGFDAKSSVEEGILDAEAPDIAELVLEAETPLARPCRLGGGSGGGGCLGLGGGILEALACSSSARFTDPDAGRSWVPTRELGLGKDEYRETSGKGEVESDGSAWFESNFSCTLTSADHPLASNGSVCDLEDIGGGGKGLLRLTGELGVDDDVDSIGLTGEPGFGCGRPREQVVFWGKRSGVFS